MGYIGALSATGIVRMSRIRINRADEEAARVVQDIFAWKLMGLCNSIAKAQ